MKIISDNPPLDQKGHFKVHTLTLQGKKNQPVTREYVHSKDAVCAVIYDTVRDKYIFTKQFRPGPKMEILELCAGMMDGQENEIETMKREILEETGYQTDTINQIVKPFYSTPGKSNERMSIYFATVSKKVAQGGGLESENEEIQVIEMSKDDIKRTAFVDGKTILGLLVSKLK